MGRVANRQLKIERYIVVLNPHSTNGKKGEQYAAELQKAESGTDVMIVRAQSQAETRHALLGALQKGEAGKQLVIVAGGDGTVHLVVNALMHPDTPAAYRAVPLTAWALGNGNDFFNSIHTKDAELQPLRAIQNPKAHVVQVHPLEWTIKPDRGAVQQRFALCYGTIGATGKATQNLSNPDHRERRKGLNPPVRLLHDMAQGASAVLLPERFTTSIDGVERQLIEMQFINGPVMTIHAHYDVRLSERGMFVSLIPQDSPFSPMLATTRMLLGKLPGERIAKPVRFQLAQTVHAQLDGEYLELPAGIVTVSPSKTALTVWATKPA